MDRAIESAAGIIVDVSVIIVSWNTKGHLQNCLASLMDAPDGYPREIIVVDNGSTDGSTELVEEQFPQVKMIKSSENLGFARANNIGIRASTGRYVCLINSDVIVLEDCIETLVEFMDDNLSVGMSGPRILNPDGTLQVSCRHFPSIWNNICQTVGLNLLFPKSTFFSDCQMKYWPHDSIRTIDALSGCFLIVRREAMDQVGLLDEDFFIYGEDIDWCKRFHQGGWEVMFYPGAEAIHFGEASSNNAPVRFYLEMQKADLQYWRKHHGKSGELIYWLIILVRQLGRMPVYVLRYLTRKNNQETTRLKLKGAFACICFLFGFNIDR